MRPARPLTPADDVATVIGAGVLAATAASVCHETLGHGLGCLIDGGHVTLLTSIWFRCHGATSLTDVAGAIAGLLGGVAAFALLPAARHRPLARFVLMLFGAISLFWVAGQLIDHPIVDRDDFAVIAHRNHWPPLWRPTSIILGAALYGGTMIAALAALRMPGAPPSRAVIVAYAAGAASAVVAGLMWRPLPIRSAVEGFLTLGVAPIGLIIAARRARNTGAAPVRRSPALIGASAIVFTLFLLTQARGLGPLAAAVLRP